MASSKTMLIVIAASVAAAVPGPAASATTTATVLAWPSMIPGHGTLQINMSAVASDTNSSDLISLIDEKLIPSNFVLFKDGDEPCANPLLYTYADAVNGTLCLGGHEQEPGVLVTASPFELLGNLTAGGNTTNDGDTSPANTDGWCNPQKSCICKCGLACMASLLLYPLCLAACMACPN
ncbi:hypothetical protein BD289DRAFT_45744 [Coniella lustricola]|uniref:Uncharacterized protein n=1 Tax=Coniella lustricola TaxID=2025994 RepID=A0A2T3A1H5_9PEZI|nr:hypothetical protein BD289DRAFT_45744 [Coniella lustricola]